MKKKAATIIIIFIVLVALLIGASFAYRHLAEKGDPQNLISSGETVGNDAVSENTQEPTSDTTSENDEANVPTSNSDSQSTTLDFIVEDRNGNQVKLSDFQGKPVVLNFWASWCGPCRSEMPDFDEMYATYGDDIHFVMVNVTDGDRETVESAKTFIQDAGYSFPIYFDTSLTASYVFQAYSLPTTYFIDANGAPIAQATGAISKDIMQQGIDMIYSK